MFRWTNVDGAAIVKPSGQLDIDNVFLFRQWVKDNFITKDEYKAIIVDLSDVNSIDSFALGSLIALYKDANINKKGFCLVVGNNDIRKMLEISSLDRILPIAEKLKDALKKLGIS